MSLFIYNQLYSSNKFDSNIKKETKDRNSIKHRQKHTHTNVHKGKKSLQRLADLAQ